MAEEITLEFNSDPETPSSDETIEIVEAVPAPAVDDAILSEHEKATITDFVQKIDLADSGAVLTYGVGAQKKVADFSERALENIRTKDVDTIGSELTDLVTHLNDLSPEAEEEKGGFLSIFKRGKNKMESLKAQYATVEKNVTEISEHLEAHQIRLMKDIDLLDRMYELNQQYFKELTMYILAGKEKLEYVRTHDLIVAQQKAEGSGLAQDAQAARDLAEKCDRFEKRVYDLELSRQIALQTAPQIRMIQGTDAVLTEKIQTTIVNTIPLWKNQMVISLGVSNATRAAAAQRQVNDMTNELLKKNADALKVAAVETAKENERGIVDIETLQHTNQQLISSLDEVMQIQKEGKEKRRAAEAELASIENQLKQKLLEASK